MLPADFKNQLGKVGSELVKEDDVLVVSHHDADGITSCAITVDLLRSHSAHVEYMCVKQLDSVSIDTIKEYEDHTLVFTDMGSGQQPLLEEHGLSGYYIIDHHPPEKEYEWQVNPHSFGFDGGSEISGAGMAYLLAKTQGHTEMAHLGVVGAVGDMQYSRGKLSSLNRIPLEDGVEMESILIENDLRMFGRQSRTIPQMLAYCSEPIIPHITGDLDAAAQFISDLGITLRNEAGEYKSYVELSMDERQKLASGLYMYLLDFGVPEFVIQRMVGEVYTLCREEFKSELRDSKEYSTVLNACGRQDRPELGVKVCLGDRDVSWSKAEGMLKKHRRSLRDGLDYLNDNGVNHMDNLYFFDAGESIKETIIGVVAGMAYGAKIIPPDKPILAFAQDQDDDSMLKVSSRANRALVRSGVHLGNAMNKCSKMVEGEGGGHDIAAGARIPESKKQEFLEKVDKLVGKQRSA